MKINSITRRRLIFRILLSALIGAIVPIQGFARMVKHSNSEIMAIRLLDIIKNKDSAKIIGREYLKNRPDEVNKKLLVELIYRGSNKLEDLRYEENIVLRKFIVDRIHDDYAQGEIVYIKGWILSLTEARLYALCTIS